MGNRQQRGQRWSRATRACAAAVVALVAVFGARPAHAQRVDGNLEAAIHLKALNYDRALPKRAHGQVTIAVVYLAGQEASESVGKAMVSAFRQLGKEMKVRGMPVAVVALPFKPDTLGDDLAASNAAAIYIAPGLDAAIPVIHAAALLRKAPTLCGDQAQVKIGVAIGVHRRGKAAGITINLKVARALGMDLDSALFAVAEVLK